MTTDDTPPPSQTPHIADRRRCTTLHTMNTTTSHADTTTAGTADTNLDAATIRQLHHLTQITRQPYQQHTIRIRTGITTTLPVPAALAEVTSVPDGSWFDTDDYLHIGPNCLRDRTRVGKAGTITLADLYIHNRGLCRACSRSDHDPAGRTLWALRTAEDHMANIRQTTHELLHETSGASADHIQFERLLIHTFKAHQWIAHHDKFAGWRMHLVDLVGDRLPQLQQAHRHLQATHQPQQLFDNQPLHVAVQLAQHAPYAPMARDIPYDETRILAAALDRPWHSGPHMQMWQLPPQDIQLLQRRSGPAGPRHIIDIGPADRSDTTQTYQMLTAVHGARGHMTNTSDLKQVRWWHRQLTAVRNALT